jgi:hypothetical protein
MVSFDKYITKFILLYLFSLNYTSKLQRSVDPFLFRSCKERMLIKIAPRPPSLAPKL